MVNNALKRCLLFLEYSSISFLWLLSGFISAVPVLRGSEGHRLLLILEEDPGEVDLLVIDPDRRNGKLSGETARFPPLVEASLMNEKVRGIVGG